MLRPLFGLTGLHPGTNGQLKVYRDHPTRKTMEVNPKIVSIDVKNGGCIPKMLTFHVFFAS